MQVEEFVAVQVARNRSKKTLTNYRQVVGRSWVAFCLARGINDVAQYKLAHHAVWLSQLQEKGLKGTTIDLYNTLVRVFTAWCAKQEYITRNPLEDFDRSASEKPLPKALPWSILEEHIGLVKSRYRIVVLRDRFLIRLLAYTGLRLGESLSLRRVDVDLKQRQVRLENTKGREATWQPFPEKLLPYLEEWVEASYREWPNSEWLLPSRTGGAMPTYEIQRAFKRYGIATPHVYRHTNATYLLEQGAGLREVQVMLRHKNVQTTIRYLKIVDQRRRAIANFIK